MKGLTSQNEQKFLGLRVLITGGQKCGKTLFIKQLYPQFKQQAKVSLFNFSSRNGYFLNVHTGDKSIKLDVDCISGKAQYKKYRTTFITKPSISKVGIFLFNTSNQTNSLKPLEYMKEWQENTQKQFKNNIILVFNNYNQQNIINKMQMLEIMSEESRYSLIPVVVVSQLNKKNIQQIMDLVFCMHFCHSGNTRQVKNYIKKKYIQLQSQKKQLIQKNYDNNQILVQHYAKFIRLVFIIKNQLQKTQGIIHQMTSKIQNSLHYNIFPCVFEIKNIQKQLQNIAVIKKIMKLENKVSKKEKSQHNQSSNQSPEYEHNSSSQQLNSEILENLSNNNYKTMMKQKLEILQQKIEQKKNKFQQTLKGELTLLKKQFEKQKSIKCHQSQSMKQIINLRQQKFEKYISETQPNLYIDLKKKKMTRKEQKQYNISSDVRRPSQSNQKTKIIQQMISSSQSVKQLFQVYDQVLKQFTFLISQIDQIIINKVLINNKNSINGEEFMIQMTQFYICTKILSYTDKNQQKHQNNGSDSENKSNFYEHYQIKIIFDEFIKLKNHLFAKMSSIIQQKLIQKSDALKFLYQLQQMKIVKKALQNLKNRLPQTQSEYIEIRANQKPEKQNPVCMIQ